MKNVILWADISDFPDILQNPVAAKNIVPNQINRILKYKKPLNRKQCLCARMMESFIVNTYGLSMDDITVDKNGKPYIKNINYNISHSGNIVICALCDTVVGCDIEKIREIKNGVKEKYFSDSERSFLDSLNGTEIQKTFFEFWTAKESYLKMTGEGIASCIKDIEIVFCPSNTKKAFVKRNGDKTECFINQVFIPGHSEYVISVCTENDIAFDLQEFFY